MALFVEEEQHKQGGQRDAKAYVEEEGMCVGHPGRTLMSILPPIELNLCCISFPPP